LACAIVVLIGLEDNGNDQFPTCSRQLFDEHTAIVTLQTGSQ